MLIGSLLFTQDITYYTECTFIHTHIYTNFHKSAALIGLIDLCVTGLKVVVISGLPAGGSVAHRTLIRHVRLIRGSHYERGHC